MGGQKGIIWGACGVLVAGVLASVPQVERDAKIAAVQTLLREQRLYPGEINGINDRETEAAIRRFQMLHSLRVTGLLDGPTLGRMKVRGGSGSLPPAVVESDREFLQSSRSPDAPAQPAPVAQAPAVKPASSPVSAGAPIPRETVENFLSLYFRAASRRDPDPELTYYADQVEYFDHGQVSREWLAAELDRTHQRKLPRMELLEIEEIVERSPDTVEARFAVRFTPPGKRRGVIEKREATLRREAGGGLRLTRMVAANP